MDLGSSCDQWDNEWSSSFFLPCFKFSKVNFPLAHLASHAHLLAGRWWRELAGSPPAVRNKLVPQRKRQVQFPKEEGKILGSLN